MTLRVEPPEIEQYVEAHTTPPDDLMLALQTETRAIPFAQMLSGNVEGRLLETLAFVTDARVALDIGTFTGNSALSMAAGMRDDCRVITCDVNEETLQIARRYFAESPYGDRIDVRVGPAIETIAGLDDLLDLVFIDADKTNYVNYYEAVLPKLSKRGLIVADNTLWSGQVLDAGDTSAETEAIRAFNDHVRSDPRVVCVQLTVRDGVTLIRKK